MSDFKIEELIPEIRRINEMLEGIKLPKVKEVEDVTKFD